jgi:hypothetical protein
MMRIEAKNGREESCCDPLPPQLTRRKGVELGKRKFEDIHMCDHRHTSAALGVKKISRSNFWT